MSSELVANVVLALRFRDFPGFANGSTFILSAISAISWASVIEGASESLVSSDTAARLSPLDRGLIALNSRRICGDTVKRCDEVGSVGMGLSGWLVAQDGML